MRVLITSGGTDEYIDGVRSLSNFSTGKTAAVIADYFYEQGANVTLLHNKRAILPKNGVSKIHFTSFMELNSSIKILLEDYNFDVVIHSCAVGDFSIDNISINGIPHAPSKIGKIDSLENIQINLRPNFKIIEKIKSYSSFDKPLLVGFKLTNSDCREIRIKAVEKLNSSAKPDLIVHNDLSEINDKVHIATIYENNNPIEYIETKEKLAIALFKQISNKLYGGVNHDFMS